MTNSAYDLLPINATALERGLALASDRLHHIYDDDETKDVSSEAYDVGNKIKRIWDPELCPEALLPWLAWALSVDFWQEKWTEAQKRQAIGESVSVHTRRGTRQAVEEAIITVLKLHNQDQDDSESKFKNAFSITEWWEQEDEPALASVTQAGGAQHEPQIKVDASKLEPLTFRVKLSHPKFQGGALQGKLYHDLIQAINAVKPLTSRFILEVGDLEFESKLHLAGGITAMEMARFTAKVMKGENGN